MISWWKILYEFLTNNFHDSQRLAANIKTFKDKNNPLGGNRKSRGVLIFVDTRDIIRVASIASILEGI